MIIAEIRRPLYSWLQDRGLRIKQKRIRMKSTMTLAEISCTGLKEAAKFEFKFSLHLQNSTKLRVMGEEKGFTSLNKGTFMKLYRTLNAYVHLN
jgi:hypothetical protein